MNEELEVPKTCRNEARDSNRINISFLGFNYKFFTSQIQVNRPLSTYFFFTIITGEDVVNEVIFSIASLKNFPE